jgi:hypothetical protein
MNIDLLQAKAFLRTAGLSFPALPVELAEKIRERDTGIFATAELAHSPYLVEEYVAELLGSENPDDYAVVAIDGYGIQSWAFHYYLVSGPLALFVRLPWGGVYTDEEAARSEIERVLAWAQSLPQRLAALKEQGCLTPEQRLLVVLTRRSESRWAWIGQPEAATQEVFWQTSTQMLSRIDEELAHLSEKQPT